MNRERKKIDKMNFNNNNNKHISRYMRRGWGDRGANKKNAKKKILNFFFVCFQKNNTPMTHCTYLLLLLHTGQKSTARNKAKSHRDDANFLKSFFFF